MPGGDYCGGGPIPSAYKRGCAHCELSRGCIRGAETHDRQRKIIMGHVQGDVLRPITLGLLLAPPLRKRELQQQWLARLTVTVEVSDDARAVASNSAVRRGSPRVKEDLKDEGRGCLST